MKSVIEQIRIVDAGRILPFERVAESQTRSIEDITLIRNPLPTLQLDDNYLLLDDTDLYLAMVDQGLIHLPIQVVPQQLVSVQPILLGLTRFGPDDLRKFALAKSSQLIIDDSTTSRPGFVTASIVFGKAESFFVHLRHNAGRGCPSILTHLIHQVGAEGGVFPLRETHNDPPLLTKENSPDAVLTLPPFTLDDLKAAALSGRLFPESLIQTLSACRVLNLDFPVSVSRDNISIDEKRSFVHELIRMREHARRTATVDGRVYLLNR